MNLQDLLRNASEFRDETWEEEMFLRHLELTEDAYYFEEEIVWQLKTQRQNLMFKRKFPSHGAYQTS